MKIIAFIVFTITAGPYKDTEITFREHCSAEILEAVFAAFDEGGIHAFAQCKYGNGPLTSMRPVARGETE